MKLQRFFINPSGISGDTASVTEKETVDQMRKVLRLRIGDRIILVDGNEKEYEAVIERMDASSVIAKIGKISENSNEPERKIMLCQALCKKDKFEWVLQKGTEAGIAGFVPVLAERSEKLGLNRERAEKILKEAAEQSERGIVPKLSEITEFEDALKNASGEKIILDRSGIPINRFTNSPTNQFTLFIGPEGGWTDAEFELAKKYGARVCSLGSTVLRTETAGLVAAAIILNGR